MLSYCVQVEADILRTIYKQHVCEVNLTFMFQGNLSQLRVMENRTFNKCAMSRDNGGGWQQIGPRRQKTNRVHGSYSCDPSRNARIKKGLIIKTKYLITCMSFTYNKNISLDCTSVIKKIYNVYSNKFRFMYTHCII